MRLLSRAVSLHHDYFSEIATFCLNVLKRPDLARQLAGDDYGRLTELARALPAAEAEFAQELQMHAENVLSRQVTDGQATARQIATLAEIKKSRNKLDEAIQLYYRALGMDYPQVDWRLNLARTLAASGKLEDAIHEVRICLRLRPRQAEATRLLEELTEQAESSRAKR
jgi:tetratricopeptide (TPR) repeat protein